MNQHPSCLCVIAQIHLHQPLKHQTWLLLHFVRLQVTLLGAGDRARTKEVILSPVAVLHDSLNNREMEMWKQSTYL